MFPASSASASTHPVDQHTAGPEVVSVVHGKDGYTTREYADGSQFSSRKIEDQALLPRGGFDWHANFDCCVYSRYFNTGGSGTVTVHINNVTNCDPNYNTVAVTLYRDKLWGWEDLGTRHISCYGGTGRWGWTDKDRYQFYIHEEGHPKYNNHRARGRTTYPS